MKNSVLTLTLILIAGFASAQTQKAFARCNLRTVNYQEIYEFYGKPHSGSAQVSIVRADGTYPYKGPAQTTIFGNQAEYQRINFLRSGTPVEIIFSRMGPEEKLGTLYSNGRVAQIKCQELYQYSCSCYAGHCQPGCYGQ